MAGYDGEAVGEQQQREAEHRYGRALQPLESRHRQMRLDLTALIRSYRPFVRCLQAPYVPAYERRNEASSWMGPAFVRPLSTTKSIKPFLS